MSWKRPDNVPFPSVWDRFQGKVLINGKPLQYRIQDITDDLVEPVIEHMCRYFLIRENFSSHDGIADDPEAVLEMKEKWKKTIGQRMGIVAIVEGEGDEPDRIAGCNITYTSLQSDPKMSAKSPKIKKVMEIFHMFYENEDLFKKYNVDKYLNALGLSVAPQYRGDDVGYRLLNARTPLAQACSLTLTVTLFSSPAAIHQAEKAGFKILLTKMSNEIIVDGKIAFPRMKPTPIVITSKIIPPIGSKTK